MDASCIHLFLLNSCDIVHLLMLTVSFLAQLAALVV